MADAEVTESNEKSGGGSKKTLIIIIAAAVVVIGGVIGALFALGVIGGGEPAEETPAAETAEGGGAKTAPDAVLPAVTLEPFVVNLSDADQSRFLKVTMAIELSNETLVAEVESRKDRIRDAVITLISGKSATQVRDSKGKLKLKQELTLRLNEILGTSAVNEILFTEFIIS